ncbi:MAG: mannosyltransferase family protein [Acidimicrobiia bacterium]
MRGPVGASLSAALPGWLLARVLVGVGAVVAVVASDELVPGARTLQLDQGLFAWDAAFYRDIADVGYGGVAREGLRFFPLLPLAARAASVPLLGNVGLALILVVNLAALAAGALLHRLALDELADRATADRAAWLLALLPPATVLVAGYAEAVLLACTIGAFLGLRRRRWWLAALLGVAAGLCRPMGLVLALPAAIEAGRGLRQAGWSERVARAAAVLGPVAGTGAYLAWVEWRHGDGMLPFRLQNTADLRGGWANPLGTVLDAVRSVGDGGGLGEALHLPWIVVFGVLLVVCWRRLPASYTAYAGVLLVVALGGHTLGSFERYGLAAFPLVLALALVLRRPRDERIALAVCGAGLAAFTTLELLGAFVP